MTQQMGLLGYPLDHSISPAFHQAALDHYSLPARYDAWPTPPERLSAEVDKLRGEEYLGANVTIPYKERVRSLLDGTDPSVDAVGAVNTIVRRRRELVGYNTDTYGFSRSLTETGGFEPKDKRVVLLGAGGAARAVVFVLAEAHVASLTIANRTLERAEKLAGELAQSIPSIASVPLDGASLAAACAGADLIVNATSVGLSHGAAEGLTPLRGDLIPPSALVYDMVYTPTETPFLLEARKAGARTLGGLPMLIYQGAAAFELWTGRKAPVEVMLRAGEHALQSQ